MTEYALLAFCFIGVFLLAYALLSLGRSLFVSSEERRTKLEAGGESEDGPIFGTLTPKLAAPLPVRQEVRSDVERDLKHAGFYQPSALMEYSAVRAVLVIVPLVITAAGAVYLQEVAIWRMIAAGLIAAGLGFSLPRVYLAMRTRQRSKEIEAGLPVAVDLINLGLSAGLSIPEALKQASHELRHAYPVLSHELAITYQQTEIHTLEHAMTQWAERTPVQEVRNLTLLLIQAEKLGTDVSASLQEFAAHFRTNLKQRAQTKANRVSFWMLFPSVFCLWVASAIILIGPAYAELFTYRQKSMPQLFEKSKRDLQRVNNRPGAAPPVVDPNMQPEAPQRPARAQQP
jgi:tight adherence protein C